MLSGEKFRGFGQRQAVDVLRQSIVVEGDKKFLLAELVKIVPGTQHQCFDFGKAWLVVDLLNMHSEAKDRDVTDVQQRVAVKKDIKIFLQIPAAGKLFCINIFRAWGHVKEKIGEQGVLTLVNTKEGGLMDSGQFGDSPGGGTGIAVFREELGCRLKYPLFGVLHTYPYASSLRR